MDLLSQLRASCLGILFDSKEKILFIMQRMLLALMVFASLLTGCKKDPLENMSDAESRIYVTNRDSSSNFGSYKTYYVDSVVVIDNNQIRQSQGTSWDGSFMSSLKSAMNARGYILVNRNQSPDLALTVSRLYNTTTNVVSYPGYYDGYGGFYDPYYWGYDNYNYSFPTSYGLYQTTETAVSVDMLDLKNAPGTNTIRGIWHGLIRGSGIFNAANTSSQVNALFEQSLYIKSNP